ncbi:PREDICTED: nucleolin 2-like [Camelina sativa]|uniref:Nucleolin 2-like n=1 Tax=Camelina sativa TaxID=90675 RepID=A0ABM1RGW5_CAMSA|nr:PREDICTED: nucleolin 2-like [Camelina sativa]
MGARASKSSSSGKRKPDDDDLETKPVLKKQKENSDEKEETLTEGLADPSLPHKFDDQEANLISLKETVEGLDETLDFVEEPAVMKNTLFIARLPFRANIQDIIDFFKDVGQVVHVQLAMKEDGRHAGYGFLEFASDNETKKALEKKNGELLFNRKITLHVAKIYPLPKYNPVEKLWYEDNLLRDPNLKQQEEKSDVIRFCGKKTTFSDDDN